MSSPPTRTTHVLRGVAAVHRYLRETLGMPIGRRAIDQATASGALPVTIVAGRKFYEAADVDDWIVALKKRGL